jgi:hypothetical protein
VIGKKDRIDSYNSQNSLYKQESEKFIHILVRDYNKRDKDPKGQELGSAKIVIDELIDTKLSDLAKQFCVCLERTHILSKMLESGKYPKKHIDVHLVQWNRKVPDFVPANSRHLPPIPKVERYPRLLIPKVSAPLRAPVGEERLR